MAQGVPVQAEQRAHVMRLHASGMGRNEIAREVDISTAAVSRIVTAAGKYFDNADTRKATETQALTLKARRQALIDRGYRRAEALYDRLEAPTFKTLRRTEGGGEAPDSFDFVPTQAERDLAQSIAVHEQQAVKLEALDSDNGEMNARSMLAELGRALGIGAEPVDNSTSADA